MARDQVLLEYLQKYNDEYLLDLKEYLEANGFAVCGLSPGIQFYRKASVKNNTYPESASYSFDNKQARILHELLGLENGD